MKYALLGALWFASFVAGCIIPQPYTLIIIAGNAPLTFWLAWNYMDNGFRK